MPLPNFPDEDNALPSVDLERIIAICDRFEADWKAGYPHQIEGDQYKLPTPLRPRLFRELLALELELRRAQGEVPTTEEYRDRFPDRTDSVDAAFSRVGDGSTPSEGPPVAFLADVSSATPSGALDQNPQ
jgi:hypothetical protein